MSRRSAPFVAPDYIDDPASKDGKKHAKVLLSTLQEDIASFRDEQFPPDILRQIRDMPIFEVILARCELISSAGRAYWTVLRSFILPQICPLIICHYLPASRYRSLSLMCSAYI